MTTVRQAIRDSRRPPGRARPRSDNFTISYQPACMRSSCLAAMYSVSLFSTASYSTSSVISKTFHLVIEQIDTSNTEEVTHVQIN